MKWMVWELHLQIQYVDIGFEMELKWGQVKWRDLPDVKSKWEDKSFS